MKAQDNDQEMHFRSVLLQLLIVALLIAMLQATPILLLFDRLRIA